MKLPIYEHTANFPFSREDVWAWHARPGAIRRIMPGWEGIRPIEVGGIQNGAKTSFKISIGPIPQRWVADTTATSKGSNSAITWSKGHLDVGIMLTSSLQ